MGNEGLMKRIYFISLFRIITLIFQLYVINLSGIFAGGQTAAVKEAMAMEDFKPVIESVEIMPRRVKPGDIIEYIIKFRNEGSEVAQNEYSVFVHFEYPEKGCDKIKFQHDHKPLIPAIAWEPGEVITDGPHTFKIPDTAEDGIYYVHIGVYQWEPEHIRFCEEYPAEIEVDRNAPPASKQVPKLSDAEIEKRKKAAGLRVNNPVVLESEFIKFSISTNGVFEILDKQSGVSWHSNPSREGLGSAVINVKGKKQYLELSKFTVTEEKDKIRLLHKSGFALIFKIMPDGKTLDILYEPPEGVEVEYVKILEDCLWVTDTDKGYVLVPARMGVLIPADSGIAFSKQFPTFEYEGCELEMIGIVKQGSALLVSWRDPYVVPELRSRFVDLPVVPGRQIITLTFNMRKTAKSIRLIFCGKGDAGAIAQAYRKEAKEKGWLCTWEEKIKKNPEIKKLFGASNVKLWSCFARFMDKESTKEKGRTTTWTFDEAAQIAEHLKNDLKIDKVLFVLGGWIHKGYDNQHPDILPAAPSCGGNEALADCSKRVKALGYLFCLHDNYQDMYRDAPSFDEQYIMRNANGNLVRGGVWNGGWAYITCSKKALELAKRPDRNLPEVKRLFEPNAYFIDTTFASGLLECFDPGHPLTKWDDMKYKQELADYSRSLFGIFGSEDGKEWAVPHSEFFEGIGGVSGRYYHNERLLAEVGGIEIPLFSMVYHDCIVPYGKYGYDWNSAASYVMYHLLGGYPLNYHSLGAHLYWKGAKTISLSVTPSIEKVEQRGTGKFEITYRWDAGGKVNSNLRVFVHFLDSSGAIRFQNDHEPSVPTSKWETGTIVREGPFEMEIPEGLKGTFQIVMGLFNPVTGERAILKGEDTGQRRYSAGFIEVKGDKITFRPPERQVVSGDQSVFCRADNGWAEGFCTTDIFIKNTHEFLSPLHEITANMLVTKYEFLTPDHKVRRSVFNSGEVSVVVNMGDKNYEYKCRDSNIAILPPFGFVIESPQFIAFHSLSWNGIEYDNSVLFTVRSLDGKPIEQAKNLRVFHGFGDRRIKIGKEVKIVEREEIISR